MKTHIIMTYVMGAALTVSTQTMAQQRVEVNGHIDVVSNYVWLGMDQNTGFSVQPALGLAAQRLLAGANSAIELRAKRL